MPEDTMSHSDAHERFAQYSSKPVTVTHYPTASFAQSETSSEYGGSTRCGSCASSCSSRNSSHSPSWAERESGGVDYRNRKTTEKTRIPLLTISQSGKTIVHQNGESGSWQAEGTYTSGEWREINQKRERYEKRQRHEEGKQMDIKAAREKSTCERAVTAFASMSTHPSKSVPATIPYEPTRCMLALSDQRDMPNNSCLPDQVPNLTNNRLGSTSSIVQNVHDIKGMSRSTSSKCSMFDRRPTGDVGATTNDQVQIQADSLPYNQPGRGNRQDPRSENNGLVKNKLPVIKEENNWDQLSPQPQTPPPEEQLKTCQSGPNGEANEHTSAAFEGTGPNNHSRSPQFSDSCALVHSSQGSENSPKHSDSNGLQTPHTASPSDSDNSRIESDDSEDYSTTSEDLCNRLTSLTVNHGNALATERSPRSGQQDATDEAHQSQSPGSSTVPYLQGPTSEVSSRKKRRIDKDKDREDEDEGENQPKHRLPKAPHNHAHKRKFACPYRKHDPFKYNVHSYRTCATSGFPDISRVKEHLYRKHQVPIHCERCWQTFRNAKDRNAHLTLNTADMCEVIPGTPPEGIGPEIEKKLKRRKKTYPGQSEEARWTEIYKLLFPQEEEFPSPCWYSPTPLAKLQVDEGVDFEPMQAEIPLSGSTECTQYVAFAQRELPSRVVRAVAVEFPTLDATDLERLAGIILESHGQVYQSFIERRNRQGIVPALTSEYNLQTDSTTGLCLCNHHAEPNPYLPDPGAANPLTNTFQHQIPSQSPYRVSALLGLNPQADNNGEPQRRSSSVSSLTDGFSSQPNYGSDDFCLCFGPCSCATTRSTSTPFSSQPTGSNLFLSKELDGFGDADTDANVDADMDVGRDGNGTWTW
ncbi:hypothetical protein BKA61DRAFT_670574 [Leptodontidium sp. MPI-SDFR-AT-0119]|nr:hypothetical protein BKA61DRAFT_670574 [Leptodontidium sp. MPI-SDFR-AT-0119]